ncbi:hypothetical protein [Desulfofustis glycolicus]|uniref:hypothetical protein n=1 Tax=Desulfofustis glycolicus TaxID=51195 RepID=UPI0009353C2D|nr:hypothetical protein [Desulfofustis glycolicus]MCB2216572.1 hypothetical protein [Desulfobulbaceae bacterium]
MPISLLRRPMPPMTVILPGSLKNRNFVQDRGAHENFSAGIDDIPRIKFDCATMKLGEMEIFQGSLLIEVRTVLCFIEGSSISQ